MLSKLLPPICFCCLFNTLNSCFDIPSLCVCESECASLLIIMSSLHMQRYARASVCVRAAFAAVVVPSLSLLCFFILKLVSKFNYTALCCSCCAARNFAFCSTVFTCFVVLINQFSNTDSEREAHTDYWPWLSTHTQTCICRWYACVCIVFVLLVARGDTRKLLLSKLHTLCCCYSCQIGDTVITHTHTHIRCDHAHNDAHSHVILICCGSKFLT